MARTNATTIAAYLAELSPDRRAELGRVRRVIKQHLPRGYRETINWGMITYEVPLGRYPKTYNRQPLCYAGLAAQKGHSSLYLMSVYANAALARRLKEGFRKAGKKLNMVNMGKSCIRFRRAEDLALDVIGEVVASTPLSEFIARADAAARRRRRPAE